MLNFTLTNKPFNNQKIENGNIHYICKNNKFSIIVDDYLDNKYNLSEIFKNKFNIKSLENVDFLSYSIISRIKIEYEDSNDSLNFFIKNNKNGGYGV